MSRSFCSVLLDDSKAHFGQERVFMCGTCVCLKPTVHNAMPEFVEFLGNFTGKNPVLKYEMLPNHPFGLCANIKYNSIVVAQILLQ